jgi:hypothetical protein
MELSRMRFDMIMDRRRDEAGRQCSRRAVRPASAPRSGAARFGAAAAFALLFGLGGAAPALAQAPAQPPAAPASAELDPETLALAREVIDIAFPPATRHAMMMRSSDAMMTQVRASAMAGLSGPIEADLQPIIERYFSRAHAVGERAIAERSPALFSAFARAYARMFTRQELIEIRAFVSTPTGAKYFAQASDLLADPDVAAANTAYMAASFAELRPLMDDLQNELRVAMEARDRAALRRIGRRR